MAEDKQVLLDEMLREAMDAEEERLDDINSPLYAAPPSEPATKPTKSDKENHTQWALGGNGRYMPVGTTAPKLPAGIYETFAIPGMWGLEELKVSSDGIYQLPDMATQKVLAEVRKFWDSEAKYKKHKLLHKRGIILHGEPGSGKTVCVKMLMNELVKQGGVVIIATNIQLVTMCLKSVRRIEPDRKLIVVFEDIDEIISYNGEAGVLSLLDGENNIANVLNLATTNFPDKLGARIINRPSRFDNKVYVGMPSAESRKFYLEQATAGTIEDGVLIQWVRDTDGMSVAHLRELVASVYCLEQPYTEVLERLKKMAIPMKSEDGFARKKPGFAGNPGVYSPSTGVAW